MLSEMEKEVFVNGICNNDYNYGILTKPVLTDTISECCKVPMKNIYTIVNNLKNKGVVSFDNTYVWVTNTGVKLYKEIQNAA